SDDQQPIVAVWMLRQAMDVFGDRRILAVRNAILPQIAFAKIRCHDAQRSAFENRTRRRGSTSKSRATTAWIALACSAARAAALAQCRTFPLFDRVALPALFNCRLFRFIEIQ